MVTTSATTAPPQCPVCAGTGWKTVDVPGKSSRVARCECRTRNRIQTLLRAARIPDRYERCTLENYGVFEASDKSLAEAKLISVRFAEEYSPLNDKRKGLLFVGPCGIGKTHLSVGILQSLIKRSFTCLFYDYRELLKEIQNSYNPNVDLPELTILGPVFEAEVLVLDDLGAVKPTEWVWDAVSHILNTRYNDKRTTIITTNFSFQPAIRRKQGEEIDRFAIRKSGVEYTLGDRIGDRMLSRLHEMCRIVRLTGTDFRINPLS